MLSWQDLRLVHTWSCHFRSIFVLSCHFLSCHFVRHFFKIWSNSSSGDVEPDGTGCETWRSHNQKIGYEGHSHKELRTHEETERRFDKARGKSANSALILPHIDGIRGVSFISLIQSKSFTWCFHFVSTSQPLLLTVPFIEDDRLY